MSGKTTSKEKTLSELFALQQVNQFKMLASGMYDAFASEGTNSVPVDDVKLMSYHIQQLMSEIGEVLEADKRWKNFRNRKYDKNAKLEEIADCFIVLMNIAMFSGFYGGELSDAIVKKLEKVRERLAAG
ncbi:MAG: MazG-like family protein [Prevotella sp.]|nr:MazG-like family protein [Prevotella sp.]